MPPGTYRVKFSLDGFSVLERTDLTLHSGTTLIINGDLKVGALSETVTVQDPEPVLDIRSNTVQAVLAQDTLKKLPNSRHYYDFPKMMLGSTQNRPDVGGGDIFGDGVNFSVNGSQESDRTFYRDGMRQNNWLDTGKFTILMNQTGTADEVNLQTSALPAQYPTGGVVMTFVQKSGANSFGGSFFGTYASEDLQADRRRAGSGVKEMYDYEISLNGPILKDKLSWLANYRDITFDRYLANQFLRDGNQANDWARQYNVTGRLMWQPAKNHKVYSTFVHEGSSRPFRAGPGDGFDPVVAFVETEAASNGSAGTSPTFNHALDFMWTGTFGNNWIMEAGYMAKRYGFQRVARPEAGPFPLVDLSSSVLSGAPRSIRITESRRNDVFAAATQFGQWHGAHEIKFGIQSDWGSNSEGRQAIDTHLEFRNGVPVSAVKVNTPVGGWSNMTEIGVYLQDRWTIDSRFTINAGIRYDYFNSKVPAQSAPANTWLPARSIEEIKDVPNWHNVVPRLGLSYDLSGRGTTVVKASVSKYVINQASGIADRANPLFLSTSRCVWNDANGNRLAKGSELTACSGFASANTTVDPDLSRHYNWEYTAGVQHELTRGVSLGLTYYYRKNANLQGTFNEGVPSSGYIPITIVNPLDGSPLVIYNQDPATVGRQQNVIRNTDILDNHYHGVEFTVNLRLGSKGFLMGGYAYGSKQGSIFSGIPSSTDLNDRNNISIFPEGAIDFDQPHRVKWTGSYELPLKINLSSFILYHTGTPKVRRLNVTRALVPTLTRASQNVRLEEGGVTRYDDIFLIDVRLSRPFRAGKLTIEPFVDAYNIANRQTVLEEGVTVGPTLGLPIATVNPRLLKLGLKLQY